MWIRAAQAPCWVVVTAEWVRGHSAGWSGACQWTGALRLVARPTEAPLLYLHISLAEHKKRASLAHRQLASLHTQRNGWLSAERDPWWLLYRRRLLTARLLASQNVKLVLTFEPPHPHPHPPLQPPPLPSFQRSTEKHIMSINLSSLCISGKCEFNCRWKRLRGFQISFCMSSSINTGQMLCACLFQDASCLGS